ncbi:YncE family protein [Geodermatophilus sp. URMC 61]|uniref:YncE family protein n=1 Tax=Geodermatophilus sp. URMC 61 TaxID=3423411 RepID=UPI00406D028B
MTTWTRNRLALIPAALLLLAGCSSNGVGAAEETHGGHAPGTGAAEPVPPSASAPAPAVPAGLPGMPPVNDPTNVYAEAGAGMLSPAARAARPLVYVPHNDSGDVWVIDPATFTVVDRFPAGVEVQHVAPSYDMRTLYASDDLGNRLTPIDPTTGEPGPAIPVVDPYNLYWLPDGSSAVSVAERLRTLVFYDPHSWAEQGRLEIPECAGIDHADLTADGRLAVFSCEFAGRVAVVDVATRRLVRLIDMPVRNTHMGPQDVKLSPDGSRFYVADHDQGGLWVIDGAATRVIGEIPTGAGAHGLYLSRDASVMYVSNRLASSVSVLDARTGELHSTWPIPGGSPDMGGVTADGSQLWLSGRYDDEVYVLATDDGRLLARIPVGRGPHGLCVWPQPGRYSLGHTGVTR